MVLGWINFVPVTNQNYFYTQYYPNPYLDRFQIEEPMPNSDLDQDLNWRPFKYLNKHYRCLTNIYTNKQHSVVTLCIWVLGYETPWTKTWVRIKDQFKNWTPTCIYSFSVYCIFVCSMTNLTSL